MPWLRAAVNGGLTAPRALSASAPPEGAGKGPPRSGGAESGGAGWGEQGCVLLPSRGSGGLLASAGRRRLTRLAVPRWDGTRRQQLGCPGAMARQSLLLLLLLLAALGSRGQPPPPPSPQRGTGERGVRRERAGAPAAGREAGAACGEQPPARSAPEARGPRAAGGGAAGA